MLNGHELEKKMLRLNRSLCHVRKRIVDRMGGGVDPFSFHYSNDSKKNTFNNGCNRILYSGLTGQMRFQSFIQHEIHLNI